MPDALKTVAEFASAERALAARSLLEAAGLSVSADVEAMAGWSWHDPRTAPVVRLSVAEEEFARAVEILARGGMGTSPRRPGGEALPEETWPCPKCATEVEPFLDVCWACGTTRDGVEDPEFEPATAPIIDSPEERPPSPWVAIFLIACPPALVIYLVTKLLFALGPAEGPPDAGMVPARSPVEDAGPVDVRRSRLEAIRYTAAAPGGPAFPNQPDLDAVLVRAWRTSVLGVLCLPPLLTIYSTWLVVKYFVLSDGAARKGLWRLYLSLAINLVVLLVVGYMVHLQLARTPLDTGRADSLPATAACRTA